MRHRTRASTLRAMAAIGFGALGAGTLPRPAVAAPQGTAWQPTSDEALHRLLAGNDRYRRDEALHCNAHFDRRAEIAAAQSPFAIVLGCSDSRVPPEVVFDQRLGDLFVVRLAGNVADDVAIGSIEYAVEHFHSPLLLVLGHEKCGAVSATLDVLRTGAAAGPFIGRIVSAIAPAAKRALHERPEDPLHAAVIANVHDVARHISSVSRVVASALERKTLRVAGASYDLTTGSVSLA